MTKVSPMPEKVLEEALDKTADEKQGESSLAPPPYAAVLAARNSLAGHSDDVRVVAVAPDGRLAVSGSVDSTVKVWELDNARACLATLEGHSDAIYAVAITSDSKRAISGSRDRTIRIWDLHGDYACRTTMTGHEEYVCGLALTADDAQVLSASGDKTVRIWQMASGECLAVLSGHEAAVTSVAVAPDGRWIASGGRDRKLRIWDAKTRDCLAVLDGSSTVSVNAVAITPDSSRVVSGGGDKKVKIWSISTGHCLATLDGHEGSVSSVSVTADGQLLVSGSSDRTIRLWHLPSLACVAVLSGPHSGFVSVAAGPGLSLSSASSSEAATAPPPLLVSTCDTDRNVSVWELAASPCVFSLLGHARPVSAVATSPDGRLLISGDQDKTVKVWDAATGTLLTSFDCHRMRISALVVTADNKLVTASWDKTVKVWDLSQLPDVPCLATLSGPIGMVNGLAVTPDGRRVVAVGGDLIAAWDLSTHECVLSIKTHRERIHVMALAADGRHLITSSPPSQLRLQTLQHKQMIAGRPISEALPFGLDYTLDIWDLESGKLTAVLAGHERSIMALATSPDWIASSSMDGTIKVWSLAARACVATMTYSAQAGFGTTLAFTPGGLLVSGGNDGRLRLFDPALQACVATAEGHTRGSEVLALAVGPGGRFALSAGKDMAVKVFDLELLRCQTSEPLVLRQQLVRLVQLFRAHDAAAPKALETLLQLCPSMLADVYCSEDGHLTTTFLSLAIEMGAPDHMVHKIVELSTAAAWHHICKETSYKEGVPPRSVIEMLIDDQKEQQLRLVLDKLVEGVTQYNQLRAGTLNREQAVFLVSPYVFATPVFTRAVCSLGREFPHLAEAFLADIGATKTPAPVDAPTLKTAHEAAARPETTFTIWAALPASTGFAVQGADILEMIPSNVFDGHEGGEGEGGEKTKEPETEEGLDSTHSKRPAGAAGPESSCFSDEQGPDCEDYRRFWAQQETESSKVVESRVLPFAYAGGHPEDKQAPSLLRMVVESGRPSMCANATIRTLVQFKWQAYGQRMFLLEMAFYILNLVLLMALVLTTTGVTHADRLLDGSARDRASFALAVALLVLSLRTVVREVRQTRRVGFVYYFGDVWNYLDVLLLILTWTSCIALLTGWRHYVLALGLAALFKWLGLLYYLQPFSATGALVRMVLQIIGDMRHFLVVLAIAWLGASSAFYALIHPVADGSDSPFRGPGHTLFSMFNMLLLGDFNTDEFVVGSYKVWLQVIFIAMMIFTLIILLNLLIALMSDSYERIQDQADIEFLMLRARLLLEQEDFLSADVRQDRRVFPRFYHVLVPLGDTKMDGVATGDQWNGVLHALKGKIQQVEDKMASLEHSVGRSVEARVGQIVEQRTRQLEQRIGQQVEDKLEAIRALLLEMKGAPRAGGISFASQSTSVA